MKKALITILQVAVTVFALWYVFRKPETRAGMLDAIHHAERPWLFAALAAGSLSPITATIRLWLLLRVQEVGVGLRRIAQMYMTGMFFNLLLPGSTGGDAVKLFYLLRGSEPRQRAGIIMSVVMDRVLGLLALMILAVAFLSMRYRWLTQTPDAAKVVHGFMVILVLAVGGVGTVFAAVQLRLIDRLPARFPARLKFLELAGAVAVYTRAWPTTLAGIVISFVGHSSFFFTYYFAARALKAGVSLIDMTMILPVINTILALPISLSGVGVRESLFQTLLHDLCGVRPEKSVPISIIGFLCTVIFYGLLGGVVYLGFRSSAGRSRRMSGRWKARWKRPKSPPSWRKPSASRCEKSLGRDDLRGDHRRRQARRRRGDARRFFRRSRATFCSTPTRTKTQRSTCEVCGRRARWGGSFAWADPRCFAVVRRKTGRGNLSARASDHRRAARRSDTQRLAG